MTGAPKGMSQPQEASARQNILSNFSSFADQMKSQDKVAGAELRRHAERKAALFSTLKTDIDIMMTEAHEILDEVRAMIKENVISDENSDGLLTSSE